MDYAQSGLFFAQWGKTSCRWKPSSEVQQNTTCQSCKRRTHLDCNMKVAVELARSIWQLGTINYDTLTYDWHKFWKLLVITSHYAKLLCSGLCKSRQTGGLSLVPVVPKAQTSRWTPAVLSAAKDFALRQNWEPRNLQGSGAAAKLSSSGQILSGLWKQAIGTLDLLGNTWSQTVFMVNHNLKDLNPELFRIWAPPCSWPFGPGFKARCLFETREPKVKRGSTRHFRGKFQHEISTMFRGNFYWKWLIKWSVHGCLWHHWTKWSICGL